MEIEFRLKRIPYIGMPNIILGKQVCPELIQDDACPEHIEKLLLPLIEDSSQRFEMLAELEQARAFLGSPGAVEKTARLVLNLVQGC